jgi:hypothetical protein
VRMVPSINTPIRVNPSLFCSQKKEPCLSPLAGLSFLAAEFLS